MRMNWKLVAATVGVVASLVTLLAFGFQVLDIFGAKAEKRKKYDAIYQSAFESDKSNFMSNHNRVGQFAGWLEETLNSGEYVPLNYGLPVARRWVEHAVYLDGFWKELAVCLQASECLPGATATEICRLTMAQEKSLAFFSNNILNIEQLALNQMAGERIELPSHKNVQIVRVWSCESAA